MKNRIALLLSLLLSFSHTARAQSPVLIDPLTVRNNSLWSEEGNPPGIGNVSYDSNQGLVLTLGAGNAARGIVSTCSVGGDFDVQVDYHLINWPAHNPYGVRMGAADLGVGALGEVGIVREGNLEFYTMVFGDTAVHTATTIGDALNTLRLVRTGSTLSGYFFRGGAWVQIGGTSGGASSNLTRFNLDVSTTNVLAPGVQVALKNFKVNTGTFLCAPSGFHATVGNQTAYLFWDSPTVPVDGYRIERDDGSSVSTINVCCNSFTDSVLLNNQLYRYRIIAIKNNLESAPSNFVLARPAGFAVSQPPPRPANPVLFLHGIRDSASTWNTTADFLKNTVGWRFGGTLSYECTQDPRDSTTFPQTTAIFDPNLDFYTVNFGQNLADYESCSPFVGRPGILHQADEVQGFIRFIRGRRTVGMTDKFNIVAHSMGGLAARSFIADNPGEAAQEISQFITYGTPHWGVSPGNLLDALSVISIFTGLADTRGAHDLRVDCANGILGGALNYANEAPPELFLDRLRLKTLPSQIQYFAIRGHNDLSHQVLTPCLSSHWDGFITIDSASLGVVPPNAPSGQPALTTAPVPLLTTDRLHTEQTRDASAILCALEPNCFVLTAHSPVDVEIMGPDGRSITKGLSEIPGAVFMDHLADETGHPISTVLVPFPIGGNYLVSVVAKPEALPTDTYTIDIVRAGVTTIVAENQKVENIPAQPYSVTVLPPVTIDIEPGDRKNEINPKSHGLVRVEILSNRTFDAVKEIDRHSLTFGRTGNEHSLAFCHLSEEDKDKSRHDSRGLTCYFKIDEADFTVGDKQGVLRGRTVDGIPFVGADSVQIRVEPRSREGSDNCQPTVPCTSDD
jgi:pimeloyl-ACP methyl ester carboxylesterase